MALVLPLAPCAVGIAGEDVPILRAVFYGNTSYSSETGLLTREVCLPGRPHTDMVSVSAPIAPDVLKEIVRSALDGDLFSIDTTPKPIPIPEPKPGEKRLFPDEAAFMLPLIVSPCWISTLEISVGNEIHTVSWNCQTPQIGDREEIRKLERALAPFMEKLPRSNCILH